MPEHVVRAILDEYLKMDFVILISAITRVVTIRFVQKNKSLLKLPVLGRAILVVLAKSGKTFTHHMEYS